MSRTDLPAADHGSLAVRHRPRRFADVVGQRHAKLPLQRALSRGALPQQLLFSGGSGLGKTTVARICAAALLCETDLELRENADSCGKCDNCIDVAAGRHPDVIEIDAASNGRVDEIREIASRAHLIPLRGAHRVYIVDEAHGLSAAGGQAFLKLLEEPPPHVVFMLATTDPERMLHTNRSRCVQFELVPPSREDVVAHLVRVAAAEGVAIEPTIAEEVLAASPPDLGIRGSLMSLEKVLPILSTGAVGVSSVAAALGRPPESAIRELLTKVHAGDLPGSVALFTELRRRFALSQLLERLSESARADLVAAVVGPSSVESVRASLAVADELTALHHNPTELGMLAALGRLCSAHPASILTSAQTGEAVGESEAVSPIPAAEGLTLSPEHTPAPEDDVPPLSASERGPSIDSTGYVVDPFAPSSSSVVADLAAPEAATEQPPEVPQIQVDSAAEHFASLLSILAKEDSAKSRLLAAKLRTATAASFTTPDGEVLRLSVPPGSLSSLKADLAQIDLLGSQIGVRIECVVSSPDSARPRTSSSRP